MVKLHAQLENLLKIRINSNGEIIPAIKRLSEMGKFDKPKELAMFAVILDRLGKMEDEAAVEESLKEMSTTEYKASDSVSLEGLDPLPNDGVNLDIIGGETGTPPPTEPVEPSPSQEPSTEASIAQDPANFGTDENIVITPPIEETPVEADKVEDKDVDKDVSVTSFTPENITDPQPEPQA